VPSSVIRAVTRHALLTSQWNSVFTAIKAAGLVPREFERREKESTFSTSRVPMLVHRPTGGYFVFDWEPERMQGHYAVFCPGIYGYEDRHFPGEWGQQMEYVRAWLNNVRREHTTADLWTEVERERELLGADRIPAPAENTPFTPDEQKRIAAHLHELGQYVRQNYALAPEQYDALESRLDYLTAAAARTGRLDWRTMFVGTMFSLGVEAILPPDVIRQGLVFALRGLGALFGVDVPDFHELPPREN
jgi:hypothetical protein